MGHKKPNCPVVKEENQKQIDRAITLLQTIPILINHPLVIAGIWYQLSQMVPSINALNNLIKLLNNGMLDTSYQVDWNNYKNTMLVTNDEGLRRINTEIEEVIYIKKNN